MKVSSAEYIISAVKPAGYPDSAIPEVAFAGRSNVGKSSLLNSMTGRKGLVKVSKTPGKTQTLNFFLINNRLMFVDTPGYGFAKTPAKVREGWGAMMETYLKRREQLRAVIVLLDLRRTPNDDDTLLLEWLRREQTPVILVFTKIDKIPKTRRDKPMKNVMRVLNGVVDDDTRVVRYSSLTGVGKRELWSAVMDVAGLRQAP